MCTVYRFAIRFDLLKCTSCPSGFCVLAFFVQEALLVVMSMRLWQWSSSSPTVYSQAWALCLLSFALCSIWCSERKCEL